MPFFDEDLIHRSDLLSASECITVIRDLDELQEFWRPRHPSLPFYTMGLASYLDITSVSDRAHYLNAVESNNRILKETFDWLYLRLMGVLSETFQTPARYCEPKFALPGFHIFGADQAFTVPRGSIHCDLQYSLLDWSDFGEGYSEPISFTAAISIPEGGAGLNTWDLRNEEWKGLSVPEKQRLVSSRKKSFHAYRRGELVIHSGHHVHQIAPMIRPQPTDRRITLQGHGLVCNETLYLYW